MSAPSDSAPSSSPCACTNISLMQLFHELKQKFPGVPDHVVSSTIELYCHDKRACETHLHREVKASLTHAYHASSSAAARQLSEPKVNPPVKCRNQPIVKHDIVKSDAIKSTICQGPQKAIITSVADLKDNVSTDDNQNIVSDKTVECNISSPVTVNIDKCEANYSADSPSDTELTNESKNNQAAPAPALEPVDFPNKSIKNQQDGSLKEQEITNYRIHKSNKITANLNERLEFVKEKKTIKKEEPKPQEKPQRPNTLNFIKANPDAGFHEHLKQPVSEPCRTVSPAPPHKETKEQKPINYRQERERGFPLNLSVNVNCHMDLSHGYDPWLEDYDSPRAITSVNLTVCTPTSNMASPVRDSRDDDSGFEGHVTVTVSPSTARAPRRRAPPPPPQTSRIESPRFTRVAPEPPEQTIDRSLIERQKERLSRLASALAQEKGRLAQLNQEMQILANPRPTASMTQRLKEDVGRLRDECDTLAKRLEMRGTETDDVGNFYSNIYTGQRPPSSWQCHMCTFRNHPLLDKCEECDMPRILVVRSPDGITVRLMPGRRKIVRSWVI